MPDADWEEDALYSLIRSYQPDAMIINNTGLSHRGEAGHIELDSVTFERGRPSPINLEGSPKYLASEMCETLGDHWGYTRNDFNLKSCTELIQTFAICRRSRSNFLFNVGPLCDGSLRTIDKGVLEIIGLWYSLNNEALHTPAPTNIEVKDKPTNFILKDNSNYYLFVFDLSISGDANVTINKETNHDNVFTLNETIKSVCWLDNGEKVDFTQNGEEKNIKTEGCTYGENFVVRIAKICV